MEKYIPYIVKWKKIQARKLYLCSHFSKKKKKLCFDIYRKGTDRENFKRCKQKMAVINL